MKRKTTQAKIKTKKGKLIASLVLFIIALICLLVFVLYYVTPLGEVAPFYILPITAYGFVISMGISYILNLLYRKKAIWAGALSTVLLVLSSIIVIPVAIIMFLLLLFSGNLGAVLGSSSSSKKITITDEDGNEYTLTPTYDGSDVFEDQYGDLWRTLDGVTFKRVRSKEVKTVDEEGNKRTLTSTYDSMFTKHYQDKDGEEWKSEDGGQTFEHIVTHATVTDQNGNEYNLRAIQAGHDTFIDQNGDYWKTFDGGKTFQRWK